MCETKTGLEWLKTIENPIIRCAALGEATNQNNPWIEVLKCKFFSQKDALIGAFPFDMTHQEYEFWKLYVRNMVGVYPAHLLPDGYTLPSEQHEWRYNPDNGFVYAALKEVEAAPTQPTPSTPTEQHIYKQGDRVEVNTLSGWCCGVYIGLSKVGHIVDAGGIGYMDVLQDSNIRPTQQPTVSPTPIAQPTDAMSLERFVQELIIEFYATNRRGFGLPLDVVITEAIDVYSRIQNQLSK